MSAERKQPQVKKSGKVPQNVVVKRCANCDIEILWPPVVVGGKTYCCAGCAAGGPCSCDYSQYHSVNIAGVIHYQEDTSAKPSEGQEHEDYGTGDTSEQQL